MSTTTPVSDVDIFGDEVLNDPYPAYEALRGLGAAVHLSRHDCWVLPRYEQVRAALGDHGRFSSVDSVGLEPALNERRRGGVLASDPPEHEVLRGVLSESLAPRALSRLRTDIGRRAEELVAPLVRRGTFDVVRDLARVFPVSVVADLIGMPLAAREEVLRFADAFFNTFGPLNARTRESLPVAEALFDELAAMMSRDNLEPGGWGEAVHRAADRGVIGGHQVVPLLRAYLVASMDTTINAIGSGLWLLAERPEAWQALREDRSLVPLVFEEILRYESPVQIFFRRTTCPIEYEDAVIPEQAHVGLLFGSANRDSRKWTDPDRFQVDRAPMDHVGFGYGVHGCAGQGLARIEAQAVFSALLDRVDRVELAGPPRRHLNNVIRGLDSLPVTVTTGRV
ncbi:cytochrome P450 [Streptomyces guryensis]|uniref:Cytochrome P450 n=1 Tax=Streptomyces guryensis TaxID=2886947 RepID=A0A9Q3VYW4_9ACTN|nr:cytochrome P450 [Streptomyces guryensis]MCD9880966.1 cytochrome P450 [Streptomyces guryensis]